MPPLTQLLITPVNAHLDEDVCHCCYLQGCQRPDRDRQADSLSEVDPLSCSGPWQPCSCWAVCKSEVLPAMMALKSRGAATGLHQKHCRPAL